MEYEVRLSAQAKRDLFEAASYIARDSPDAARAWIRQVESKIRSLSTFPHRFALIPESEIGWESLRQCVHQSHRIIYRIDEDPSIVTIVRIYHTANRKLSGSKEE